MRAINLTKYLDAMHAVKPLLFYGKVIQVIGLVIKAVGIRASIGELCEISLSPSPLTGRVGVGGRMGKIIAEVVGFQEGDLLLMPLGELHGIHPQDKIIGMKSPLTIEVGEGLVGRVVDALGKPIDGKGSISEEEMRNAECGMRNERNNSDIRHPTSDIRYPVRNSPPHPLGRGRISEPIETGIRAIDGLLTCGKGQRVGIFSGSGVGKSVLLGMIAQNTRADVNVIALVGERGREVRDFIEKDLGSEGLRRSVVVVATSDQPPLLRVQCALTATTIAEYFRAQGKDVMLMMDSVTRFAMALREIGLAIGEPPTSKGYTPSVFSRLPLLLERAGLDEGKGSITGLYTVLVEGDDMNEPVADALRSILDGHIVLSRTIAMQNLYPAIDINASISRLMPDIVAKAHKETARKVKEVMAIYEEAKDLINIGAYVPGSNPKIDYAIKALDKIRDFIRQEMDEKADFHESIQRLINLLPNDNG